MEGEEGLNASTRSPSAMGTLSGKINTSHFQPGVKLHKSHERWDPHQEPDCDVVRMTATSGRENKMVSYFSQAIWFRKAAPGLPQRDINPQQKAWSIGATATSGVWNGKVSFHGQRNWSWEVQWPRLVYAVLGMFSSDRLLLSRNGEAIKLETYGEEASLVS